MPVHCANCGEELLGAVNRCWKCGKSAVSRPGPADLPPIRRSPISGPLDVAPQPVSQSGQEAIEAVLVDDSATAGAPPSDPATSEAGSQSPRRGSPFADGFVASGPGSKANGKANAAAEPATHFAIPTPANYRRNSAATGGAFASLVLAILSLIGALIVPIGGLVTALLGLMMGVWGLYSERRGVAIVALLLCCIGLAVAGFYWAVELYTYINGYSPWETPAF